jgi:hypothetical protein
MILVAESKSVTHVTQIHSEFCISQGVDTPKVGCSPPHPVGYPTLPLGSGQGSLYREGAKTVVAVV